MEPDPIPSGCLCRPAGLSRGQALPAAPGADPPRSPQLGFFRRARYAPPAVPQYHAVKIPREERQQFREEKMGTIQRKEWAVNWSEASDGHVTPSSA